MSTGSGVCLRSGGYSLRSKGSSSVMNRFPDPPKSRSPRNERLKSKATKRNICKRSSGTVSLYNASSEHEKTPAPEEEKKSEATKRKIAPVEDYKRYLTYLASARNRKPFKPSWVYFYVPGENTEAEAKAEATAEAKAKAEAEAITITDPEEYFFGKCEGMKKLAHKLASEAITYMRKMHGVRSNWELVKACMYQGGSIEKCIMLHVNFQAKRVGNPEYPMQTFFAQVRYQQKHVLFEVDCCVSLGASDSLPETRDNQGCFFCSKYVHHPRHGIGGWSNGWPDWKSFDQDRL